MKKNFIKKVLSLLLILLVFSTAVACDKKDKQTVISNNVGTEAKQDEYQIQKDIELGNNYLQQDKYDDAKQVYEKAISLDKGNKQTYLKIKDKYLEKGRLDDAYYIIKSAIKNNVDTTNMNIILAEISGKFETTNIKDHVQKNNKYILPDDITMKINGLDTKVLIKWNNNQQIDTNKIGDFTYEGISEQYGRKVKIVLNITAPAFNGKISGVVKKVYESNGKRYLTVHEVDFYLGEQAKAEEKKDGGSSTCYEDYYIRDKKTEKDYMISDSASLRLLQCVIDPCGNEESKNSASNYRVVSYDQFKKVLNSKNQMKLPPEVTINRGALCWLTINNNVVDDVYSQYTP